MFYKIILYVCKFICFILGPTKCYGIKNIYKKKSFLIISNHRSSLDPFIIATTLGKPMAFLAKESLFKNYILKFIFKQLNVFPANKNNSIESILKMISFAKNKKPILIFPEGTRNKTNLPILPFKHGASLISIQSKTHVIPVAIYGSNKIFGSKKIIFGKPIAPTLYNTKDDRIFLTACFENSILNLLKIIQNK